MNLSSTIFAKALPDGRSEFARFGGIVILAEVATPSHYANPQHGSLEQYNLLSEAVGITLENGSEESFRDRSLFLQLEHLPLDQ